MARRCCECDETVVNDLSVIKVQSKVERCTIADLIEDVRLSLGLDVTLWGCGLLFAVAADNRV